MPHMIDMKAGRAVKLYQPPQGGGGGGSSCSASLTSAALGDTFLDASFANYSDIAFSADGTKMFVAGGTGGEAVREYDLDPAWDITSATYVQGANFSSNAHAGVAFNGDGTKIYVCDSAEDVYEWSLGTAYDLSTKAASENAQYTGLRAPYGLINGLNFNADGTKLFTVDALDDVVVTLSLSTPYDLTTASYDGGNAQSVVTNADTPWGVAFSGDGLTMFVTGDAANVIAEYSLGTAFTPTTATYVQNFGTEAQPRGLFMKPDCSALFLFGASADEVIEITL